MTKTVKKHKTVAKPMERVDRGDYSKKLLQVKGDWFDEGDYKKIRKDLKERIGVFK